MPKAWKSQERWIIWFRAAASFSITDGGERAEDEDQPSMRACGKINSAQHLHELHLPEENKPYQSKIITHTHIIEEAKQD